MTSDLPGDVWTRLAVSRDGDEAEQWRDALEAADVAVEVRISDALYAQPGTSTLTAIGGGPQEFAYEFFVPSEERELAAAVLIDAGWRPSRQLSGVSTATLLRGALIAAGGAVVLIVARVALG